MVISGGTGTLLGPIAGAAIVVIMKNVVSAYIERWNLVLGVIFIAHHQLHAGRAGAGLGAAVARAGVRSRACAAGATAGAAARRTEARAMTALAVNGSVQVVRRPARHRQRRTCRSSPASGG